MMGEMITHPERYPRTQVVLARTARTVVGWVSLDPIGYSRVVDISVYVAATKRKRGIGTRLVRHALKVKSKRWKSYGVEIYPWSQAGRRLYGKFGLLKPEHLYT